MEKDFLNLFIRNVRIFIISEKLSLIFIKLSFERKQTRDSPKIEASYFKMIFPYEIVSA